MDIQQVVAAEQLIYKEEIDVVKAQLGNMGIKPDTEIRVYPLELGWYATALVGVCVFIFTWHVDSITLDIHPFSGFYANGALIHRKDIL